MSQSNEFHVGEIVDVTIKGSRIVGVGFDDRFDSPYLRVAIPIGDDEMHGRVHLDAPGVTVERRAPAEWPPQAGDLWRDRSGEVWFAFRDHEIFLVPMYPVDISRRGLVPDRVMQSVGPMALMHREDGTR